MATAKSSACTKLREVPATNSSSACRVVRSWLMGLTSARRLQEDPRKSEIALSPHSLAGQLFEPTLLRSNLGEKAKVPSFSFWFLLPLLCFFRTAPLVDQERTGGFCVTTGAMVVYIG